MKLIISDRCKFCLISLLTMLFFVIMFPPVQYKKIGLMYGYSGFDEGEVLWIQLLFEIFIVAFMAGIIYLIYPVYKNKKR
jgi:hypothetical protein